MSLDWSPEVSSASLRLKQDVEYLYGLIGMDGVELKWEDVHRLNLAKERIEKMLADSKENAA